MDVKLKTSGLRSPDDVMRLERIGSFHQTRISFVRSLLRKVMAEAWEIERVRWDLDDEGYGTAVYQVTATEAEVYSVVFFTQYLDEALRTDRVIAEQWDVAFVLCEGVVTEAQIAELRENVPLQEAGRYLPYVLVLSRANKSTRNFEHVLSRLAENRQPDVEQLARVGYLYRTTAVYGNGKFGLADFGKLAETASFAATFRAQMFAVWMLRHFALEQVHYLATLRNPLADALHPEIQRYLGVGNATGLGMAPFLVTHPRLINQWISQREAAIARVLAEGAVTEEKIERFNDLMVRARAHVGETETVHERQAGRNRVMVEELGEREKWKVESDGWVGIIERAKEMSCETQEVVHSVLLELYPELVDDFGEEMDAGEEVRLDASMGVGELQELIEREFGWALSIDFDDRKEEQWFWYRSAEKEEPRLGNRWEEAGAEKEQRLDIGRQVKALHTAVSDYYDDSVSVIDFLLDYPQYKGIVRRVQGIRSAPYGEIRDNLIGKECLPIDLLRCKLSFFGASKFDPRSNLWVRITLFQGAPLVSDIGKPFADDWFWPVAPTTLQT